MSTTSEHNVPIVTGTKSVGTHTPPGGGGISGGGLTGGGRTLAGGREQKEIEHTLQEGVQQVKHLGEEAYHRACTVTANWRHYPKLLTSTLLIGTFLIGALSAGMMGKTGLFGGGSNYLATHWDRETADAHHALDVVLDHLMHPHLYETKQHLSYVEKAKMGLKDIFQGILPSSIRKGRSSSGRGMYDEVRDTGRDVYDKATGRSMYDKATGRGLMDKASDLTHDLSYGARRGMEGVKDVGYGITDKLGDMADRVKHTLVGDHGYPGEDYAKEKVGGRGWFGLGTNSDDDEELDLATKKIDRVVRHAERGERY